MAWLILSLSYTKLWSMWLFWLVFCGYDFHSWGHGIEVPASSVCPLMDDDKRFVQASLWEKLAVGKLGLALLCKACCLSLVTKSCPTLATPWTARFICPWDSPGKNTGVGCRFLLQGIFPTQESNTGLLHCKQFLYQLSYKEGGHAQ